MPIQMESEVPMLFLGCSSLVFLCKIFLGTVPIWKCRKRLLPVWIGHLASELLSFYFLSSFMFRGLFPHTTLTSDNSICIGLFGVFWALSTFLLVYLVHQAFQKK